MPNRSKEEREEIFEDFELYCAIFMKIKKIEVSDLLMVLKNMFVYLCAAYGMKKEVFIELVDEEIQLFESFLERFEKEKKKQKA